MRALLVALILAVTCVNISTAQSPTAAAKFHAAIAKGDLAWRLSEPEEVKAVLGEPEGEETPHPGDAGALEVRFWIYPGHFGVSFMRERGTKMPWVLASAKDEDAELGPKPGERLKLRTTADFAKLRPFTGLQNIDASRLDLRNEEARLRAFKFDTATVWPPADRLPKGFDPAAILNEAKNPGLGVRGLHARGIDGRGVRIAIIDQPLVPNHVEIAGRFHMLAEIEVAGWPPQMHGPAVSSLAAGKTLGVAPGANIEYISIPMWKSSQGNGMYIDAIERILAFNKARDPRDRIRVVSISDGGFRRAPKFDEWTATLAKAEAEGLLVITCDTEATKLEYAVARALPDGDREKAEGYTTAAGNLGKGRLLVPSGNRTYAQFTGPNDYAYETEGGFSWVAAYLNGVAALGFQVNPLLTPERVRSYMIRTTTTTSVGSFVNPPAFVEMCQQDPDAKK